MAGTRSKIARDAREAVLRRIVAWVSRQEGTQQAICESLQMRGSQLHTLVNEGAERCSLEYLLDVWERCGGSYTLLLNHEGAESGAGAEEASKPRAAASGRGRR